MSFWESLKQLGNNLVADAEKALGRVSSKQAFKRVVYASYLIAAADGHVDDEEKVAVGKVVSRKLPHFKPSEVAKQFDEAAEVCALSMVAGKIELKGEIAKSAGTEDARTIMLAVLAVANADNEFSDPEKVVAREICASLGLRAAEYGL